MVRKNKSLLYLNERVKSHIAHYNDNTSHYCKSIVFQTKNNQPSIIILINMLALQH